MLYKEVEQFAFAFGDWKLTESIQRLEVALFGGHPSLYASQLYPWAPLSEYLHLCYFAYLLLLPVIGGCWYFNGRRRDFHELLLLVSTTLLGSYLFYISYPVDSPFYLFKSLKAPRRARWRFPECTRFGLSRYLAGCVAATAALGLGLGPGHRRVSRCDRLRKVSLRIRRAGRTACGRSGHAILPSVPSEMSRLHLKEPQAATGSSDPELQRLAERDPAPRHQTSHQCPTPISQRRDGHFRPDPTPWHCPGTGSSVARHTWFRRVRARNTMHGPFPHSAARRADDPCPSKRVLACSSFHRQKR